MCHRVPWGWAKHSVHCNEKYFTLRATTESAKFMPLKRDSLMFRLFSPFVIKRFRCPQDDSEERRQPWSSYESSSSTIPRTRQLVRLKQNDQQRSGWVVCYVKLDAYGDPEHILFLFTLQEAWGQINCIKAFLLLVLTEEAFTFLHVDLCRVCATTKLY